MKDEQDVKLVLAAEATLGAAPLREPDWDAFAARVDAALGSAGATDDSLLLPPLPESIEDGQEPVAAAAESTSLAELARAAVARRGAKEAVDLAKESLAIASQGRGGPRAVLPTILVEREDSTFPSARRKRAVERAAADRAAVDTRGPWIGVAIAAVGLAAGFGLYIASKRTQIVEVPVAQNVATAEVTTGAALPSRTSETKPEPAKIAAEAPPAGLAVEVEQSPAPAEAQSATALADKSTARAGAAAVATRPAATTSSARPEKVVLDEDHTPNGAKAAAVPKPATSVALRPAELNESGSGMSDCPSTGAAQAAVGAVLGAARACIAGQAQPSSATLTFGSNGEVTGVSVSGGAEGTPAASCIKGALGKARVQPFATQSFSLGVTIRPL